MKDKGLVKAINEIGSAAALAGLLGISRQAVNQWQRVPHDRVLKIEEVSGVSRSDLRPDLYPRENFVSEESTFA